MRDLRDYTVITGTYWAFTLTDGALRMLVLLFLYQQGHSPLAIASLFLFYEFFGVVTNLLAGWVGARFGLKSTLFAGLALQIVACSMLAGRAATLTISYVMVAQAMSGIAKDLTKMSSKSYLKLVVPAGDSSGLMKWVALLTGSKNTLKGMGFFLGGLLLTGLGFQGACLAMASFLLVALVVASTALPSAPGKASVKVSFRHLFSTDSRINWLSAARLFLFGSRDVWFVLALPIFLSSDLGWGHSQVGGFLALWIIGYGFVQAVAPSYVGGWSRSLAKSPPNARRLGTWTTALLLPLAGIATALWLGVSSVSTLTLGLGVFAVVFATSSAIHSYLILAYAEGDKVALRVGFYYMANAAGRLTGTVLSGAVFQAAGLGQSGLVACIAVSTVFVVVSAVLCVPLRLAERGSPEAPAGVLPG